MRNYARFLPYLALAVFVAAALFILPGSDVLGSFVVANVAAPATLAEIGALLQQQGADFKAEFLKAGGKIAEFDARLGGIEQELARRPGGGGGPFGKTAGQVVADSKQLKEFGGSANRRQRLSVKLNSASFRAAITSVPGSAGQAIIPDTQRDIVLLPRQRLTIRELIAPGETTSNMIQYVRQTLRELNADVVSEGDRKPESNLKFELENAPVVTIAHWVKASKQVLDDFAMLRSTIDSDLRYGLQLAEETEFLFGDGSTPHINGIVPQSQTFVPPFGNPDNYNRFDVLLQAIAQTEQALLPATGIVLNDLDLTAMRTIKDADGNYIVSGGPFAGPITSIWGRPVVGTPAIPADDFLVGAFRDGAQVFDREEAGVEVATENEDDFLHNMVVVRGEQRTALAVKRPAAFVYGTFEVGSGTA